LLIKIFMFRMLLIQGGVQLTMDYRGAANLESKKATIYTVGGGGGRIWKGR
jgi:hypothetical protein